jgi:hypothetical protein
MDTSRLTGHPMTSRNGVLGQGKRMAVQRLQTLLEEVPHA